MGTWFHRHCGGGGGGIGGVRTLRAQRLNGMREKEESTMIRYIILIHAHRYIRSVHIDSQTHTHGHIHSTHRNGRTCKHTQQVNADDEDDSERKRVEHGSVHSTNDFTYTFLSAFDCALHAMHWEVKPSWSHNRENNSRWRVKRWREFEFMYIHVCVLYTLCASSICTWMCTTRISIVCYYEHASCIFDRRHSFHSVSMDTTRCGRLIWNLFQPILIHSQIHTTNT